ncbi:hypothetical protein GCM10009750_35530 [Agromyces salentinus]|uniref:Uncharacterized protein n=1 Tax=Agromyces salentinus TaxID=269421 RepID=A0ABN2N2T5_9MICO
MYASPATMKTNQPVKTILMLARYPRRPRCRQGLARAHRNAVAVRPSATLDFGAMAPAGAQFVRSRAA